MAVNDFSRYWRASAVQNPPPRDLIPRQTVSFDWTYSNKISRSRSVRIWVLFRSCYLWLLSLSFFPILLWFSEANLRLRIQGNKCCVLDTNKGLWFQAWMPNAISFAIHSSRTSKLIKMFHLYFRSSNIHVNLHYYIYKYKHIP